jgi:hypothetical protein
MKKHYVIIIGKGKKRTLANMGGHVRIFRTKKKADEVAQQHKWAGFNARVKKI